MHLARKKKQKEMKFPHEFCVLGRIKRKPVLEFNAKNVKTRQKGVAFAYAHCTLSE